MSLELKLNPFVNFLIFYSELGTPNFLKTYVFQKRFRTF